MKARFIITALTVSISVIFCRIDTVFASALNETEDLIIRYQEETKCKNVSVVVYDNGAFTYYGDNESLYQIGSMTKAFTGLAIEKLIDGGLLDEDGNISDYIPGFEAYYDSEKVDITIRNLLEQKSGYTNNEKDYPVPTDMMTLSDWADSISGRTLKSMPGTAYSYSNANYDLLGLIIENVSDMTYREFMEREILRPLGLKNTFVGMPEEGRIVEGTRPGYRHVFDYHIAVKEASIPAGYFYSNTKDMGRFIEIWTGNTDIPEDFKEPLSKVKQNLNNKGDYFGGWELFADGITGHSGGTPNYSSRIVFDEKKQTGVCVLANLNVAATTDSLCNGIFETVTGKTPAGLTRDIWTIFDKIFSGVTAVGLILFITAFIVRKRSVLIALDVILICLLASVFIVFPIIFGAQMKEILFTWAPWSLTGGLLTVAGVIAVTSVKLLTTGRNADNNKDRR